MSTTPTNGTGNPIASAAAGAAAALEARVPRYASPSAATDVPEFLADLTAGQFDQQLSIALSRTAARVVDHKDRKGKVTVTFEMEHIAGTCQVRVEHRIAFQHPTALGKAGEETEGEDVMHVGPGGALSLTQPSLLDKAQGQLNLG